MGNDFNLDVSIVNSNSKVENKFVYNKLLVKQLMNQGEPTTIAQLGKNAVNTTIWEATDDDLMEEIGNEQTEDPHAIPYIGIMMYGRRRLALVDSGASITIISKGFYDVLVRSNHVDTIPIPKAHIRGVIKDRIIEVNKQAYIEMMINDIENKRNK